MDKLEEPWRCSCFARSAEECACGAWDVPIPDGPEALAEITRLKGENERLIETLEAGAVCMSPTERVRWIDRATAALLKARSSGKAGSDAQAKGAG